MYTYNMYCFGHKLAENKELNNLFHDLDVEFFTEINNREWGISLPYHGGQILGDCYSTIFGISITDDDHNPNLIQEIQKFDENEYLIDYSEFLSQFLKSLEEDSEEDSDIKDLLLKLKEFIEQNKPTFYSVEVSS